MTGGAAGSGGAGGAAGRQWKRYGSIRFPLDLPARIVLIPDGNRLTLFIPREIFKGLAHSSFWKGLIYGMLQ